ncbi:MAG: tRNA pseudouridine synthase 1 [Thelocarpon impressellum]|nr:MAG: tRNA pseudouridine synthase 1 [Thelocarpon impressellum]
MDGDTNEDTPRLSGASMENKASREADDSAAKTTSGQPIPHDGRERTRGHARQGEGRKFRGGRSTGGAAKGPREKRKDSGRAEWSRNPKGKRPRDAEQAPKRRKVETEGGEVASAEDDEERKPKRKVAVMIGYSGSGYKGMQLNAKEKTIEGDLFAAFVAAGAISKANSDDPKKSSLVRCARTDKGVHAAGNVISLKLIIEDADIVGKINAKLSPQVRVWGIERTNGSFSCYQLCDSRVYEYLIPTHAFLPPHPRSFLGRKIVELAEQVGDLEGLRERQAEVASWWDEAEEKYVKPVLDELDPGIREAVLEAIHFSDEGPHRRPVVVERGGPAEPAAPTPMDDAAGASSEEAGAATSTERTADEGTLAEPISKKHAQFIDSDDEDGSHVEPSLQTQPDQTTLTDSIRRVKAAYLAAKKAHRIDPARLARVRAALALYEGTRNFHNYTPDKAFRDPSARRHIKTFTADAPFVTADGAEWLSLRVHGQSFMMHQIRKMVGMAALVVRAGCTPARIADSLAAPARLSVPKAPGLGLLLDHPVFDSYNARAEQEFQRAPLDFGKYEAQIREFKEREIYERIWREEERDNPFNAFFAHVDGFRSSSFLYLTSAGLEATKASFHKSPEGGAASSREGQVE